MLLPSQSIRHERHRREHARADDGRRHRVTCQVAHLVLIFTCE